MKQWVKTDEDGRIYITCDEKYAEEDYIEFDFPEDFSFIKQNDYRIVDGELIYDPLPEPPEIQIQSYKAKLASSDYAVIKVYEAMVTGESLPEEEASRYSDLIIQRREWRQKINELEASLKGGEADGGTDQVGTDPA